MIMLLATICVFSGIGFFIGGIIQLCDNGWNKLTLLCFSIVVLTIIGGIWIYKTEPYRALKSTDIVVEFAQVKNSTVKSITMDKAEFKYNTIVQAKYPINFSQFKIGDIVRYEYAKTELNEYILKIEKVKGE